jgi:hypothetical protein
MAQACHYAQSHIDDREAWENTQSNREHLLQCTSFQMACFFAQNTNDGHEGVDWDFLMPELRAWPMKSEYQWLKIINDRAIELGGWKTT